MTVQGIGGIFFKSQDPEELASWYERHLGLADLGDGVIFGWRKYDRPDQVGHTIWSPFSADTTYFEPSEASWMVNFRVDDLDETLERLDEQGVEIDEDVEDSEYGRFGWALDPEGNKIELWEPPTPDPMEVTVPAANAEGLDGVWLAPPATTMAATGDLSDRSIEKECVLDLSAAQLWRMWTTSEGMAEWWVDDSNIELRVGGPMELYFLDDDQPEGLRGSEHCKILSFVPEKMLSFTWNAPPNLEYVRPRHTHVVVEFDAEGPASTRLTLHHLGWPEEDWDQNPQWEECFSYFDSAWEKVLELLQKYAG